MPPIREGTKFQRLELEHLKAIAPHLELLDDFRRHGVAEKGASGEPVARDQFFRRGCAADQSPALEDGHSKSRPRQVPSRSQAVVAGSNDDNVEVRLGHIYSRIWLCFRNHNKYTPATARLPSLPFLPFIGPDE